MSNPFKTPIKQKRPPNNNNNNLGSPKTPVNQLLTIGTPRTPSTPRTPRTPKNSANANENLTPSKRSRKSLFNTNIFSFIDRIKQNETLDITHNKNLFDYTKIV
jgi:hypothetical protein